MFIIHVSNALQSGTDLFHQSHAMHHPEEQRISRQTYGSKLFHGHAADQTAGVNDFNPILQDVDLKIPGFAVVAEGHVVMRREDKGCEIPRTNNLPSAL